MYSKKELIKISYLFSSYDEYCSYATIIPKGESDLSKTLDIYLFNVGLNDDWMNDDLKCSYCIYSTHDILLLDSRISCESTKSDDGCSKRIFISLDHVNHNRDLKPLLYYNSESLNAHQAANRLCKDICVDPCQNHSRYIDENESNCILKLLYPHERE